MFLYILLKYQSLGILESGFDLRFFRLSDCLKKDDSVSVQVTDAYSEFDAGRVIRILQAFINRDLSSFYFSIIKDR